MIGQVLFGFRWPVAIWKPSESQQQSVISYITVACVLFCGEDPRIQTKQNDWGVTKYTSQNNNIIEIGWWHLNDPADREKKKLVCTSGRIVAFLGMNIYLKTTNKELWFYFKRVHNHKLKEYIVFTLTGVSILKHFVMRKVDLRKVLYIWTSEKDLNIWFIVIAVI